MGTTESDGLFNRYHELVKDHGVVIDGEGSIGKFSFNSSTFEVEAGPHFPVQDRKMVQIGPDLEADADLTIVYFPGWGEGPGQVGDKELLLLEAALEKGYSNPRIICLGPSGRGTLVYQEHYDEISRITVKDEQKHDAPKLIEFLKENSLLQGDIVLEGHSLGTWNVLEVVDDVNTYVKETNRQLSVILEEPVAVEGLGLIRPSYILRVINQLPFAILNAITGAGWSLNKHEYADKMLNGETELPEDEMSFHGSVPDSARRFILATMTWWSRIEHVAKEPHYTVIQGKADRILPKKMAASFVDWLLSNGAINADHEPVKGPHSFKSTLDSQVANSLKMAFHTALPEK